MAPQQVAKMPKSPQETPRESRQEAPKSQQKIPDKSQTLKWQVWDLSVIFGCPFPPQEAKMAQEAPKMSQEAPKMAEDRPAIM